MDNEQQASFTGWARVEVMGHQTHIGFVRTEAYGQAVMFRIDIPELPEREYVLQTPAYVDSRWTPAGATVKRAKTEGASVLVGAGSIYRILPCTQDAALKAIETLQREELKLVALPESQAIAGPEQEIDAEFEGEEDDEEDDEDDEA